MVTDPATITKGLVPALDRRQVSEKFVAAGQNFLLDAQGPYSAFGSDFSTFGTLDDWDDAAFFTIERQITFIFTNKAVLSFDAASQRGYVVFAFPPTTERFPWSGDQVGGLYYFVKKGVDVIQYNPFSNEWRQINGDNTPGMPPDPYALVSSAGRLFIAAETVLSWSAIDDGLLWEDLPSGAGAQGLAIINNGTPLGVHHTELGVVTYTTQGAMLSRRVDAPNPYRHRPYTEHFIPINPYAIIEIADGVHIILDQTGLYQNNGQQFTPWQPLMGEFLHSEELPKFDTTIENNPQIRLFFNRSRNWFFVSLAEPSQPNIYKRAYVLYIPRDEWGSFDHRHVLLNEFLYTAGVDPGFNYGFIDPDGLYHRFSDTNRNQNPPDLVSNIFYLGPFQQPNGSSPEGGTVFGDVVEITDYDRSTLTTPGLYNTSLQPVPSTFGSIDAFIDVGLFRLRDENRSDRISRITQLTVGFDETIPIEQEDWLLQFVPDVSEDWLTGTGEEDWNEGLGTGIVFDLTLIGTLDGKNVYAKNVETPSIIVDTPEANYYTCDNSGIWHILRFSALEPGQSFHIKYLEPNMQPAGDL